MKNRKRVVKAVDLEFLEKEINNNQSHLSERQKEVIELYFIKGVNLNEIAEQMNLSLSTARNDLNMGLFVLKKRANEKEYVKALSILYGKPKSRSKG